MQLLRFLCVGAPAMSSTSPSSRSACTCSAIDYRIASVVAFLSRLCNNFWWNRHWTFDAAHHHPAEQGLRFFLVSLVVFGFAYASSSPGDTTGMEKVLAQAIANVAATPLSFIAQKLWSFKA